MEFDYDPSQDGRSAQNEACKEVFFMCEVALFIFVRMSENGKLPNNPSNLIIQKHFFIWIFQDLPM